MSAKAVVFAYHDIGCAGIEALLDSGYEIAAVFTHADDPGENTFYASVAQLCARKGIAVHAPEDVNHPLWIERINQLAPDYLFSFYYRNVLAEPLLATAGKGAFNLHGSLLPRYRGRAPANWVLVNGESETGVTLHRMVKRADAGAIVAQQPVAIERSDTALSLHGKLRVAAADLLRDTLPALLAGKVSETPQNEAQATVFGRRTAADGELFWHKPAEELFNLVRAVTQPYPGAFCAVGEHKLIVWSAEVVKGNHSEAPGRVISIDPLRIEQGLGLLSNTEALAGNAPARERVGHGEGDARPPLFVGLEIGSPQRRVDISEAMRCTIWQSDGSAACSEISSGCRNSS